MNTLASPPPDFNPETGFFVAEKNPPDLQARIHDVVVDFSVLSRQRRQDDWGQKQEFSPPPLGEKGPKAMKGDGVGGHLHVL